MNYIDLYSLGPTDTPAALRVELLGLSGTLLPRNERGNALYALRRGDSITCLPSAYPYWRRLSSNIPIVNAEDTSVEDDPRKRIDSWLQWWLVGTGMSQGDAGALMRSPPKTSKHQNYGLWVAAEILAEEYDQARVEVKSLPPDLETVGSAVQETEQPYKWTLVRIHRPPDDVDYERVAHLLDYAPVVGLDVETDVQGSEPNETRDWLVGVGLAFGAECFYGTSSDPKWMELLRTKLRGIPYVAWNAKYDATVLRRHSITPGPLYGDGMLAAYLVGEHRAALKPYVLRTYGVRMIEYDDVTGGGKTRISDIDPAKTAEYCCGDAYWALRAEADLRQRLNPKALVLYEKTDLPMVDTIVDMELVGIRLDRESAKAALDETIGALASLGDAIDTLVRASGFSLSPTRKVCKGCRNGKNKKLTCETCSGAGEFFYDNPINPASSHQLVQWLHGHLKIPIQAISQKTQQPSVSSLALLRMQHEHAAIPIILRWRTLEKRRQFLVDWLAEADEDDRIHTSFTLAHVHSGRVSSCDPNLTQVELLLRKYFVADEGKVLVAADYHSLEIRVAAFTSRDEGLMSIVNSDPTTPAGDIHAQNVLKLFGIPYEDQHNHKALRTRAKNYMYGALYWSKGYEVVEVLEKLILADPSLGTPPTLEEIMKGIRELRAAYPHYFLEWGPYMIDRAREQGNTSYTAFRRPRVLSDLVSPVKSLREAAERATLNHIVQGTAADLARMACNKVTKLEGGTLLLQVHDELLSEVLESEVDRYKEKMIECMELGQPLAGVPLVVDDVGVGRTWEETHK